MKLYEELISQDAIRKVAEAHGVSPEEVEHEIAAAIDAAWESDALSVLAMQALLFPNGKPSAEECIATIAKHT